MREDEDYYYSNDGMVPDSAKRGPKTRKTKIPKFKRVVKKNVPHTDLGEIMGNLMLGMCTVFPVLSFLTMSYPKAVFLIIGFIFVVTWAFSNNFKFALIILGTCMAAVLLGFIPIFFIMALLG